MRNFIARRAFFIYVEKPVSPIKNNRKSLMHGRLVVIGAVFLLALVPPSAIAGPPGPVHCFFKTDHTHDGTKFRIYRIDNCVIPTQTKHPLIVFSHGEGFPYTTYGAFMQALAGTSAIVVSVDQLTWLSNAERAELMLSAIDYIYNVWNLKHLVDDSIAFVGHSRGGEAVLTAAREYSNVTQARVDAVISIMGTDNQKGGGEPETLLGDASKSYLSLAASRDEDVLGYCVPAILGCANTMRGGLTLYDRTGREWGQWDVGDSAIDRSAKRLHGFTHGGWVIPYGVDQQALNTAIQREVVHEYVTRFLRWQLFGIVGERAYFTTAKESALVALAGVVTQYVQHSTPNLAVDTFGNASLQDSDLGQDLVATNGPASFAELPAREHDVTAEHDSGALSIRWRGGISSIRWTFPKESQYALTPTIDATPFPYFSLRATQIFANPLNASAPKLRVRLTDKNNKVADVVIGTGTPFAIPTASVAEGIIMQYSPDPVTTVTNSMATLRIPLLAFAGIDKSAIRSIAFIAGTDSQSGAVIIDSLDFTH